MADSADHKYSMTLSLNVLKHLGFGLYSNVPAVLSEAVANAWDADAEHVWIEIDPQDEKITIQDDGHGMTVNDVNERYLNVGYERRKSLGGAQTSRFKRHVMGRKGIGKLSLFSIAKTVEIHSVRGGDRHGFKMDTGKIEEVIVSETEEPYHPDPVDDENVTICRGTKIILTNVKRQLYRSSQPLRRRLARRFSVIGLRHHFQIELDGMPVTIEDRGYHDKLQYMWTFGANGLEAETVAENLEHVESRTPELTVDGMIFSIDGWIGTVKEAGQLKDPDTKESINKIIVMVRGKLAQEDILEEFGEGGVYSKYIIGEIHADFLDQDDQDDIATTSRQRIIEDDPRYEVLRGYIQRELKFVQGKWSDLRNEEGRNVAVLVPQIQEWYGSLSDDHRIAAKKLFGRINQLPIDSETHRRQLFISGILAFESLRFRNILHRIDSISISNLEVLSEVFVQLDDLEASAYFQISKDRLRVIEKLQGLVDEDAKERALQEYLFKHLWLLDPSWERATHTAVMEQRVNSALDSVYQSLPCEDRRSRLDIYYTTTGGKHVIVELKRASRILSTSDLVLQIEKYYGAALDVLTAANRQGEPLEFICVVGKPLRDWSRHEGRTRSQNMLAGTDARVVTYDELINNSQQAYEDFLEKKYEAGRIYRLITGITAEDAQELRDE